MSLLWSIFLLSSVLFCSDAQNSAVLCENHPAYKPTWIPPLLSSWTFVFSTPLIDDASAYLPKHTDHLYAPVNYDWQLDKLLPSTDYRYEGLDLLHFANTKKAPNLQLYLNRKATIYMLLDVSIKTPADLNKTVSLIGWRSEGWAYLYHSTSSSADKRYNIVYGVHDKLSKIMPEYVYVLSKPSFLEQDDLEEIAYLPQNRFVRERVVVEGGDLSISGAFNVLIAEHDGSPSTMSGIFNGSPIKPSTRCPDELHDTWKAVDDHPDDPTTRGMSFATFHPPWDPCFWCAYDHEHGSNPAAMRYKPLFGYTAFKNNKMKESHPGFKGYMFTTKDHFVYFNAHARLSDIGRINVRFHTVNIVVVERTSARTVLMDLRFKADFGFAAVRMKNPRDAMLLLGEEGEKIKMSQIHERMRTINVLNIDALDPRFRTKPPKRQGVYEEWNTLPMCSKSKTKRRGLRLVYKRPSTGILSLANRTKVTLGTPYSGNYILNSTNLYRSFLFGRLRFSAENCPYEVGPSGVFYTDPRGTTLLSGPGENALRQYIAPGFHIEMTGKYETEDTWSGLFVAQGRGFFANFGLGIDPKVN